MATRGRKPTPTAIKELEGNPGKRPLNKNYCLLYAVYHGLMKTS